MEIIGPLLISLIAGLSTLLGCIFIFIKFKNKESFIAFSLAFAASVMIMISILDLIPHCSLIIIKEHGLIGILYIIILFVMGILIINTLNKCINKYSTPNNLYRVGVLSMIAICIHNFPEGIATFMASYKDISVGISLGIAIMMHNIPEGISIAVPLFYSTKKKSVAVRNTLISSLAEPLGALLAYIVLYKYISDVLISFILINVSGIMITIAINDLYPESLAYKKPKWVTLGLISGVVLVLINHFIF